MEEPDTAAARAKEEVKRARYRGVRGLGDDGRERSANDVEAINLTDLVTSSGTERRVGRRGVLAGVASGLNVALRGIWKWAISRTSEGTGRPSPVEQRGSRTDEGKVEGE